MNEQVFARIFIAGMRKAFYKSGPIPVFNIVRNGHEFVLEGVKRLSCEVVPSFYSDDIPDTHLMDMRFQGLVNSILNKEPIVLNGEDDLVFKLPSGRIAKIPRVSWSVDVYSITRIERNADGIFGVLDYEIRDKPLNIGVSYGN